jgi:hypothetical protein
MAVHIALHEIGTPFEGKPMSFKKDESRSPGHLKLNAEGKQARTCATCWHVNGWKRADIPPESHAGFLF